MRQTRDSGGRWEPLPRSEAKLNQMDELLERKAREARARFESDVARITETYRSEATWHDHDYIGSAKLEYCVYQIADQSYDEAVIVKSEELGWALDEDAGDVEARDACAQIIRDYAAELRHRD